MDARSKPGLKDPFEEAIDDALSFLPSREGTSETCYQRLLLSALPLQIFNSLSQSAPAATGFSPPLQVFTETSVF